MQPENLNLSRTKKIDLFWSALVVFHYGGSVICPWYIMGLAPQLVHQIAAVLRPVRVHDRQVGL